MTFSPLDLLFFATEAEVAWVDVLISSPALGTIYSRLRRGGGEVGGADKPAWEPRSAMIAPLTPCMAVGSSDSRRPE